MLKNLEEISALIDILLLFYVATGIIIVGFFWETSSSEKLVGLRFSS
jgi:hypothetical protein